MNNTHTNKMDESCSVGVLTETEVIEKVNHFAEQKKLCAPYLQQEVPCHEKDQAEGTSIHRWKQLEDHPGYYLCTHGTIVSARRRKLQQLKPFVNKKSKPIVASFGRTSKNLKKLVLETFDPHFKECGGQVVFDLERWDNPCLQHLEYISLFKKPKHETTP